MTTTIISKYYAVCYILLDNMYLVVPISRVRINYSLNEIPVAEIEVPYGQKLVRNVPFSVTVTNPNWFIEWTQLINSLSRMRPCQVIISSITTFGPSGSLPVFTGYIVSCNIVMTASGAKIILMALGKMADLGFGSTLNSLVHPASPTDFSNPSAIYGLPVFTQTLSREYPGTAYESIFMPFFIVNLKSYMSTILSLLLIQNLLEIYAARRITRSTGLPVPPVIGQARALNALLGSAGTLISNPFFSFCLPAFIFWFAEVAAMTLLASPAGWSSSSVLAKLLEMGQIFNFVVAPTSGVYSSGVLLLPDNPLSYNFGYTIGFRDIIEMYGDLGVRSDIRGVVLVGEAIQPYELDILSNQSTILGYYDAGWFPHTIGLNFPGTLLAIPAPPWLRGMTLADVLTDEINDLLIFFATGQVMDDKINQFELFNSLFLQGIISDKLVKAGIVYAGSVFHKLAYSGRVIVVKIPLSRALSSNAIPGPGTIVRILGPTYFRKDFTNLMMLYGRVHRTEIVYDIEKREAYVVLQLTHVRYFEEVKNWIVSNFPFYGVHPMWQDPLFYLNPIGGL